MIIRLTVFAALLAAQLPQPALAQIKPAASGKSSFNAPRLSRHRRGLILPNQPGSPRVGFPRRRHRIY